LLSFYLTKHHVYIIGQESRIIITFDEFFKSSSKWINSIQNIIQDRIAAFEKDPEIRRKFMATVYEADITD
jgi:hypothetical protein